MENPINEYVTFCNICIELVDQGATRISPMSVLEEIRQRHHVPVSNNLAPLFRDRFVTEYPQFSKFFLVREKAKGKHKKSRNYDFLQFLENLDCEIASVTLINSKGQKYNLPKAQAERITRKSKA